MNWTGNSRSARPKSRFRNEINNGETLPCIMLYIKCTEFAWEPQNSNMKMNHWRHLPSLLSLENQLRSVNCAWGIGNALSHWMSFPVTTEGVAKLFLVQHRHSCELQFRVLQQSIFRRAQRKESSRLKLLGGCVTLWDLFLVRAKTIMFVWVNCFLAVRHLQKAWDTGHPCAGLPNVPLTFRLHQIWLFSAATLVNVHNPISKNVCRTPCCPKPDVGCLPRSNKKKTATTKKTNHNFRLKKTSGGLAGFISGAKTCAISHFSHTMKRVCECRLMWPFPEAWLMLTTELKGAGEVKKDWLNYGILSALLSEFLVATIFSFGRTAGPMNSSKSVCWGRKHFVMGNPVVRQ